MSEEDNVVEFPTSKDIGEQPETLQERIEQADTTVLTLVNKNRKEGVAALENKVNALKHTIETMSSATLVVPSNDGVFNLQDTLIDIEKCLSSVLTTLEAKNSLSDMLIHDMAGMIQNLENIASSNWQNGANLQILIEVLNEKGIVTKEEIEDLWNKLIPDAVKEFKKQNPSTP